MRTIFPESESKGRGQDDNVTALLVESFPGFPCEAFSALPLSVTDQEIRASVPAVPGLLLLVEGRTRPEKIEDIPASEVKDFRWVEDLRAACLEAHAKIHLLEHRFNDDSALNLCWVPGAGLDTMTAIVRGMAIEANLLPPDYCPDLASEDMEREASELAALAATVRALGIKAGRSRIA